MGIRGLETFVDNLYIESQLKLAGQHSNGSLIRPLFVSKPLAELRFVVDGNQICYKMCHSIRTGQYSGNYDQIYEKTRAFMLKLKPFVQIVIFDGSKGSLIKATKRLTDRIIRVANINVVKANDGARTRRRTEGPAACVERTSNYSSKESKDKDSRFNENKDKEKELAAHMENLRDVPPLFSQMILFEVLNELQIDYLMAEDLADKAVALYSSGHNDQKRQYAVLSRDSYFYAYDLPGGYVSWQYVFNAINDAESVDEANTSVPVFYMRNLLDYVGLKHHKSWLHFCVMCGEYDIGIDRNVAYCKLNEIDIKHGNLVPLLEHIKANEDLLVLTEFECLRRTYLPEILKKVDELLRMFCMENVVGAEIRYLKPLNGNV
jgi:hypothetical protein